MLSYLRICALAFAALISTPVFAYPAEAGAGQNDVEKQRVWLEGLQKLSALASIVCEEIYPPIPARECFEKMYHAVLEARDPHSAYFSKEEFVEFRTSMSGEFPGIGVEIRRTGRIGPFEIVNVFEGTPAHEAKLLPDDLIVRIGEKPAPKYDSINDAVKDIRGKAGTSVTLSIMRKGNDSPFSVTIVRQKILTPQVNSEIFEFAGKKYLIVHMKKFDEKFAQILADHMKKGMKKGPAGTIMVLKNNPGGDLSEVVQAQDLFYDAPDGFVSLKSRDGVEKYNLRIGKMQTPGDITNGLPMLVIVNGRSASASEIFAGGMQLNRAPVAGERTWGKGSVQNIGELRDGSAVKVTSSEYVIGSPTRWLRVQCDGIIPDIPFREDGKPVTDPDTNSHECDLAGSIPQSSTTDLGAMTDRVPYEVRDPKGYANGKLLLEVYKAYLASKPKKIESPE